MLLKKSEIIRDIPKNLISDETFSKRATIKRRISKSVKIVRVIPGRLIFTTTFSPLTSSARYTTPIEAVPIGFSSIWAKTSEIFFPRLSSITLTAVSKGIPLTLFCKSFNSRMRAGSKISSRVAISCPSLIKLGPNSSKLFLSCDPKICHHSSLLKASFFNSETRAGRTNPGMTLSRPDFTISSEKPCRLSTVRISRKRETFLMVLVIPIPVLIISIIPRSLFILW